MAWHGRPRLHETTAQNNDGKNVGSWYTGGNTVLLQLMDAANSGQGHLPSPNFQSTLHARLESAASHGAAAIKLCSEANNKIPSTLCVDSGQQRSREHHRHHYHTTKDAYLATRSERRWSHDRSLSLKTYALAETLGGVEGGSWC